MKEKGFHLMELLLALSLIAILLALGLPRYSSYLAHERRLSAQVALLRLAGQMETYYAEHNSYEGANLALLDTAEYLAHKSYRLVIQSQSASAFELAAIPEEQQAKADFHCGTLMLNSKGVKRVEGSNELNACW